MAKVRMLRSIAGERWAYNEDEIHDVPEDVAAGMVRCGSAVRVADDSVEMAVTRPPEIAARRTRTRTRTTSRSY
jgi:hypothetical protein